MSEQAAPDAKAWSLSADRPILGRNGDKFERASFADALVSQIVALPKNDSFVLGLVGPWGSGKTSILNMVEEGVAQGKDTKVLKFNPWLFSGTEQLAAHFFREIAAQLQELPHEKLRETGRKLRGYGELLSPLSVIPFIGTAVEWVTSKMKLTGDALTQLGEVPDSAVSQRNAITKLLREQDQRLLVIVDDLDRLPKADIRELFKLVRLTADFPNTTYLLAFDRPRVEAALGETEGDGRAYLEKILQVTFDVPALRDAGLTEFLVSEIEHAMATHKYGPFYEAEWGQIFHLAIRPLFETPRDVRRYTNAIPVALSVIGDEIAVADILAIEAVRTLVPDVWTQLHSSKDLLINTLGHTVRVSGPDEAKQRFEKLLAAAGDKCPTIRRLLSYVFPPCKRFVDGTGFRLDVAREWRKKRRLVDPNLFQFYFEKSLPCEVLRAQSVQQIFECLGDENKLRDLLAMYDETMIEHVCDRLRDYGDDLPPESVEPALVVLFEQYQRLREGRRGFIDPGAEAALIPVGECFLRRLKTEADREDVVKCVFARMKTLSERYALSNLVGWHPMVGHKLVSRAFWAELEQQLHEGIVSAAADTLADERDLLPLLQFIDDGTDTVSALGRSWVQNDKFVLRLLRGALREPSGLGIGEAALREYTLQWQYMVELFGHDTVVARVDDIAQCRGTLVLAERENRALTTAMQYRDGWRPRQPRVSDPDWIDDTDGDKEDNEIDTVGVDSSERSSRSLPGGSSTAIPAFDRRYRADCLLHLLWSALDSRRETAYSRIRELADQKRAIPQKVLDQILELVKDHTAARILGLDLHAYLRIDEQEVCSLATDWFASKSVSEAMSKRIAGLFEHHPKRLPTLIDALKRASPDSVNSHCARHAIDAVASLFEHHAADITSEVSVESLKVLERFSGIGNCETALENARKHAAAIVESSASRTKGGA